MSTKKKVAVFLGGRSPEHDISIITGLQVLDALDTSLFDAIPVYISTTGEWFTGDALRDRGNYLPDANMRRSLTPVRLHVGTGGKACLESVATGFMKKSVKFELDVAIPAFHGVQGEDGCIQGAFEMAGLPYTGMRLMATSLFMDKVATKYVLEGSDIPLLPTLSISRPKKGLLIPLDELKSIITGFDFPCILKPRHLGSSIGVAKVDSLEELAEALPEVFRYDHAAIIEPFVPNLVEYNVSVASFDGETRLSAIERPKTTEELLDFATKYSSGGSKKLGTKSAGQPSEGMLSLTRDINPELPAELSEKIIKSAILAFERLGGTGSPRIDFLSNSVTNEVWLNEVNPLPGSFGYFLWEAATPSVLFSSLLEHLIEEAFAAKRLIQLPADPTPEAARLFARKG